MLFKIILTSESVSQILKCNYSNEVSEHYFPVRVTCQPNFALPPKKEA